MSTWLSITVIAGAQVISQLISVVGAIRQERARAASHCIQMQTAGSSGAMLYESLEDGSVLQKRTFPAGTALMREGERADGVMVILDGRTKVCTQERGRERVIAERVPGDFVGERGTAPGGVRSATVIAIEPVLALVITTEDFADFASEHPPLPDIVKQQVYDRVTGPPDLPG